MAYEYKVGGQTVRLETDPNLIALRFHPTTPRSLRAEVISAAGMTPPSSPHFEIPEEGIVLVSPAASTLSSPSQQLTLESLSANKAVERATPVFRVGDNKVVPSDRIIVGLKENVDPDTIATPLGLALIRHRENEYLFRVPNGSDPLQVSSSLSSNPDVAYSEPDFITIGRHVPKFVGSAPATTDVFVPRPTQYALIITKSVDAWNIVVGSPNVRIAILDEGVDTAHPDLVGSIEATYDGVDGDTYQTPNRWDGHGTCCAGLAAANAANLAVGVKGVAAGCRILAARIAYSRAPGENWVTTNEMISRCIDWAWETGASVISNSWGGGAPSNAIVNAFERARTRGRQGLGCVVVIAAGNASGAVNFPANIGNVLCVSASNEYDEFKNRMSRDGETFWGSCFGREVSVAAPGVHNLTTDMVGEAGYDRTDYFATFNGTSSATPIVAGACALILSAVPNLREDRVRTIVMASADKVGVAPYHDGRNDYFGYGRLNVLRAVQAAMEAPRA